MNTIYAMMVACHALFGGDCRVMVLPTPHPTVEACTKYNADAIATTMSKEDGKTFLLTASFLNPVCHDFGKEITADDMTNELAGSLLEKYGPKGWKRPTKGIPMNFNGGAN